MNDEFEVEDVSTGEKVQVATVLKIIPLDDGKYNLEMRIVDHDVAFHYDGTTWYGYLLTIENMELYGHEFHQLAVVARECGMIRLFSLCMMAKRMYEKLAAIDVVTENSLVITLSEENPSQLYCQAYDLALHGQELSRKPDPFAETKH